MKKLPVILSVSFLVFLVFSSCQQQSPVAPDMSQENQTASLEKAEQIALEMIQQSGWEIDPEARSSDEAKISLEKAACGRLKMIHRDHIAGDIFHYSYILSVGSHPFDRIGIHRVIKERGGRQRCGPIRAEKNIFLQHGDCKDFEGMFLPGTRSPNMPNDFGIAVYLAENDVDVWGIDQAWALVPEDVSDFSFMMDWGLQKQVTDLQTAMKVAAHVRRLTGCGVDKLNLLGYSSGVWTGYALLNEETQISPNRRVARGFVAADGTYKTDSELLKQSFFINEYNRTKDLLDQGQYGDFVPFATISNLARTDPNGDSPLIPGFTNMQAAMFFAAGPLLGEVPFHYFAGIWENDLPVNLQYVTNDEYLDFMAAGVPWEAAKFMNDYCAISSEIVDLPFDDHLGEITVPILNLSPAGGFGELSKYTTTLLGSPDITHVTISLHSPEEALLDFGHVDLFLARNAESLVWQPILRWIKAH